MDHPYGEAADINYFLQGDTRYCRIHVTTDSVERINVKNTQKIRSDQVACMQNQINRGENIFDQIQEKRLCIS